MTADATFAVERRSAVRVVATLRAHGRHDGDASYVGSFAYAAEPVDPVALAVIGPGTHELEQSEFSGDFRVDAREQEHRIEILIQRLDEADVLVEGELSAEAEAPDGCSIDLEVFPE